MRTCVLVLFFATTVILLTLQHTTPVFAEVCTGDTGRTGECSVPMACSPENIDGRGTCSGEHDICCASSNPAPPGGTLDCADSCISSDQCMSGLVCDRGICNGSLCPACTGISGFPGACFEEAICRAKGKNSYDGGCTGNTPSSVCCTNAPTEETCQLEAVPPFLPGAYFLVNLITSTPNTTYAITSSPVCRGSDIAQTDNSGNTTFTSDCGPPAGTYTITAKSGANTCSTSIEVVNEPGPPCIGESTRAGWCVVLACPLGTIPDGAYPKECSGHKEQLCCVPHIAGTKTSCEAVYLKEEGQEMGVCELTKSCGGYFNEIITQPQSPNMPDGAPCRCICAMNSPLGKDGCEDTQLATAIGCIPIEFTSSLVAFILRWAVGIGGGISFLLILLASFQIATSSGNPDRLKAGQELLTSAISGLILLVFSVFVLQLIGVQILRLPGF